MEHIQGHKTRFKNFMVQWYWRHRVCSLITDGGIMLEINIKRYWKYPTYFQVQCDIYQERSQRDKSWEGSWHFTTWNVVLRQQQRQRLRACLKCKNLSSKSNLLDQNLHFHKMFGELKKNMLYQSIIRKHKIDKSGKLFLIIPWKTLNTFKGERLFLIWRKFIETLLLGFFFFLIQENWCYNLSIKLKYLL